MRKGIPDDALLIETVFSPLAVLADLCEDTKAAQRLLEEDGTARTAATQT